MELLRRTDSSSGAQKNYRNSFKRKVKMKKIILNSLVFLGSSIAFAAPVKIGLVLSTLQEERYQKDQKYFIEEAKKLGFEPIVVSADNNAQTQSAKVEN